jgi:hypothetical protein
MPPRDLTRDEILSILSGNPPNLSALTAGLRPDQLCLAPGPSEWSARDVLAHLRSCADVWGSCIQTILAEDRPTIRARDPRTWIKKTDYRQQEFQPSLEAYSAQRSALLAVLEPLAPSDWQREGTVTGPGKPLIRTVHTYAQWMAVHERSHLKQIERIAKTFRG